MNAECGGVREGNILECEKFKHEYICWEIHFYKNVAYESRRERTSENKKGRHRNIQIIKSIKLCIL